MYTTSNDCNYCIWHAIIFVCDMSSLLSMTCHHYTCMYLHLIKPRWCSVAVCCSVLQCVAVCYNSQRTFNDAKTMVCCSVLQCVAAGCSNVHDNVLQKDAHCNRITPRWWSVAVCCSILQYVAVIYIHTCMYIWWRQDDGVLQCVSVCCSIDAVCCSMLQ